MNSYEFLDIDYRINYRRRRLVVIVISIAVLAITTILAFQPSQTTQQRVDSITLSDAQQYHSNFHATSVNCQYNGFNWECQIFHGTREVAVAQANPNGAVFAPVGYVFPSAVG